MKVAPPKGCTMAKFHTRDEWLQSRSSGIGGTDASTILGCNPYQNELELFARLIGVDVVKKKDNVSMERGRALEDPIRKAFQVDHPEFRVYAPPRGGNWSFERKDKPYLRASLDGLLRRKSDRALGVLEIKTVGRGVDLSEWDGKIPDHYYAQVMHYCLVLGAKFAVLRARIEKFDFINERSYWETRDFEIDCQERAEELKTLEKLETAFWERVQKRIPPSVKI